MIGHIRQQWHLLLLLLIAGALTSCTGSSVQYDLDKEAAFIAMFPPGMSKQDVQTRLGQMQEVTLFRERTLDNGEILLSYIVSEELYGAREYKFYFTEELVLREVIAVVLPD